MKFASVQTFHPCVCVCEAVRSSFYMGWLSFLGLFGPLPRGLVLGINSFWPVNDSRLTEAANEMPVAVGPYGQSQPSCFDRVKMGFVMGCAVGMAAGALFGTFSCLRIGMRGRELMGGIGKTMMQSGGTFGTFMAIGMGIRC